MIRSYSVRLFNVAIIAEDIQFKMLKDRNDLDAKFNVTSEEKHTPIVELYHRVIEERCLFIV